MELDEIKKLPIYTQQQGKYLLKKNIVENFPENFGIKEEGNYEYATTSGTTSDRMEIIRTPNWWYDEYIRTYSNNNKLKKCIDEGLHKVIFTTAQCSNLICFVDKPPLEKRIIGNTLYVNNTFNPWNWTKEDVKQIIEEINYFKPYYLDADPVYLSVFLYLKDKYNIKTKIHIPEIITLSYEFVTKNIKNYIKSYFSTEVLNLYGTTEFGYLFLEKEGKMHICKDLVDVNLLEVNKENNLYTLIVDSFKNKYMPLLNYRVGDMVIATPDQVKKFKKEGIIEDMAGREKDLLGNDVSYSTIDCIISKIDSNILFYQLYMISNDICIFKYIKNDLSILSNSQEEAIKKEFKNYNLNFKINFKAVEDISPEISGKFSIVKKEI